MLQRRAKHCVYAMQTMLKLGSKQLSMPKPELKLIQKETLFCEISVFTVDSGKHKLLMHQFKYTMCI